MDNKGFGILALLAFIALIGITLFSLFSFLNEYVGDNIFRTGSIPNYKNEYTIYMKEHNIILDDKK